MVNPIATVGIGELFGPFLLFPDYRFDLSEDGHVSSGAQISFFALSCMPNGRLVGLAIICVDPSSDYNKHWGLCSLLFPTRTACTHQIQNVGVAKRVTLV